MPFDFTFTPEQEMLRKAAMEFAERDVAPKVEWMDETGETPTELVKKMMELGFGAIVIPREYGGAGLGHIARIAVLEEISRISPALGFCLQIVHLGQAPVIYFGSEEQKRKWLPGMAKGELIATCAVTEPTGGSDVLGIQTTAKREGEHYVLNGRKCFITNVHISNMHGVLAKTGEGPKGLSFFMIEPNTPGVKPGRKENKSGLRGLNTGELILENVRVPRENMIGGEGDGLRVALTAISNIGRPGVNGVALGIVRRCLEEAAKYSKQRALYGKPISELQAIQWYLAEMYVDYETTRLLTYYAAWLRDKGARCDAENAAGKYYSVEAAVRCAHKLIQIFGGYGVMKEIIPQRLLRDAEVLCSAAGTQEIMKLVMFRKALEYSK
jgi:alkylation response protein AidB-like acyl-CoA dehydrogenase